MYTFSYKIKCCFIDDNDKPQHYIATGLGLANSYTEAAHSLEEQYGDEIIEILSIYLMDTSHIIALPEEVVEDYKLKEFPDIEYQQPIKKE